MDNDVMMIISTIIYTRFALQTMESPVFLDLFLLGKFPVLGPKSILSAYGDPNFGSMW